MPKKDAYKLNIVLMDGVSEDALPVRMLKGMSCAGKLNKFLSVMDAADTSWQAICTLEDDFLAFVGRNRWCGVTDGWFIEVGPCAALPKVPDYNEWGNVSAWVLCEQDPYDDYVIVVDPAGMEAKVYTTFAFYDALEARPRCTAPFADDSAMMLNGALKGHEA